MVVKHILILCVVCCTADLLIAGAHVSTVCVYESYCWWRMRSNQQTHLNFQSQHKICGGCDVAGNIPQETNVSLRLIYTEKSQKMLNVLFFSHCKITSLLI